MVLSTSTIISQSTPSILKHIANTLAKSAQSPHALLYVLSPASSLPESHLSDLVTTLTSVPNSVGCISAPLPLRSRESATAVSLALFKHPKNTPFRSTIPGRQPTSVGRWHTVGANEDTRARQSPATTLEEIRGITRYALPSDIRDLSPQDVKSVVYVSDNSPEGLTRSLSGSLQYASQIGLLASPTPFLTGRPYTLFRGREIFSSGAVGLCLTSRETRFDVELPHLTAITGSLTVTNAEGNLVHSLDGTNPAKLIISAMDKHNMNLTGGSSLFKEDQYYLGVLKDGGLHRLYQIMSGGPSRGTVSLEGEDGPPRGSEVKIYHLPANLPSRDISVKQSKDHAFKFLTLHPDFSKVAAYSTETTPDADGTLILPNTFLAASENGCMVRRCDVNGQTESAWRFSVPTGSVHFGWHS